VLWDSFLVGLQVGTFTSATLIFMSCVAGKVDGGVSFVFFIALTFCFSTAVGTLFKLFDNYIKEEE